MRDVRELRIVCRPAGIERRSACMRACARAPSARAIRTHCCALLNPRQLCLAVRVMSLAAQELLPAPAAACRRCRRSRPAASRARDTTASATSGSPVGEGSVSRRPVFPGEEAPPPHAPPHAPGHVGPRGWSENDKGRRVGKAELFLVRTDGFTCTREAVQGATSPSRLPRGYPCSAKRPLSWPG
jgi:hypothetical protein